MPEQSSPLDLSEGDPFGPHNLPYGVFSTPTTPTTAGSASVSATTSWTPGPPPTHWAPPTRGCSRGRA